MNVANSVEPCEPQTASPTLDSNYLEELADGYLSAFKGKVIQKLLDLTPTQFEQFAGKLLKAYGFQSVTVTKASKDGGIDGFGKLKFGLAILNAAFQCKRWQNTVGAPDVNAFRGSIQGKHEHGYFFTTSGFTTEARAVSFQSGAAPIILFDGVAIVQPMIEKGFGVSRRPLELYEDNLDTLFQPD